MGGLVLRHLIVKYGLRPAGVVFVASPLGGSNMEQEIKRDLDGLVAVYLAFSDNFGHSIP
jgi:hypothetical protein